MIDIFWYFLSICVTFCVCIVLFTFYRALQGQMIDAKTKELHEMAQKLSGQVSKAIQIAPQMLSDKTQYTGKGLEGLGVDGIIDALGLPAIVKPMARGFIENLLQHPEKIEALLSKVGINIGGTDVTQNGFK